VITPLTVDSAPTREATIQSRQDARHIGRVVVALSGGVDSAVAAWLLQRQGYDVQPLFMKNWEEDDRQGYCAAAADLHDAELVCERLGLGLRTVNLSTEYWDRVFTPFLAACQAGKTPNPDVLCNREIKFRAFLDHALALGATHIATGHYARIVRDGDGFHLLKGCDSGKDQSYFLHRLDQSQLARALFPLGELTKAEVRHLAIRASLPVHAKKDSTGICFIGEQPFRGFLSRYLDDSPGAIETPEGEVVGQHVGLAYYTLGQRRGLGIGGKRGGTGAPWYVIAKDLKRRCLIVTQGFQHPALYASVLIAEDGHWIPRRRLKFPLRCQAKTRYRQIDQPCEIELDEDEHCRIRFDEPQWAPTPGQFVVFYDGAECLGGGIIRTGWACGLRGEAQ
jgi:tRNA-specific 2-thiouridylase